MFNKRDQLFLNRMENFITAFETNELRKRNIYIRMQNRKICNNKVLEYAFILLQTGMSWKQLQYVVKDDSIHYQTVYKRFSNWEKYGILNQAWKHVLEKYVSSRLSKNAFYFKDLYIDTTTIKNIGGKDCTGSNPTDRGRLGTKVSIIMDKSKVAISEPVMFPANIHDSKTVDRTLDSIPLKLNIDGRMVTRIAADKAYNSKPLAERMNVRKIRIVTKPKKNARNPEHVRIKDMSMFKKRIYIEHYFGIMKRLKRLRIRMDSFEGMYKSFWLFAMARQTFVSLNTNMTNI